MTLIVYVSGPYTRPDQATNVRAALDVADQLLIAGFVPFVPHLTHFWDLIHPHDYERWISYDLAMLRGMDVLLRIPGESLGSDREVAHMLNLKKPVVYGGVADLLSYCAGRVALGPSYVKDHRESEDHDARL